MKREQMRRNLDTFSIYALRYTPENKIVYVGQTRKLLEVRLNRHMEHARKPNGRNIAEYIRTKGFSNFSIECLELCHSQAEADEAENRWISKCSTLFPLGCNIWPGSVRGARPEHINKQVSKALMGHIQTEETRIKLREARARQAPITEAGRARISAAHKGKKLSVERRAQMVEVWKKRKEGAYS